MIESLRQTGQTFLLAFIIVAGVSGYWALIERNTLLARQDNPRNVLFEQRLQRGRIVDRNGLVLADTLVDSETGVVTRHYPILAAAPVVGYYSLRYGVGGVEEQYDTILRGIDLIPREQQVMNNLLHQPQVGGDIRLSIDATLQAALVEAFGGRHGAAVLIDAADGEMLALGSYPSYDPNLLDEQWDSLRTAPDSPLVNRASQGSFQPGTILQSLLLGEAYNARIGLSSGDFSGDMAVTVEGARLPCAVSAPPNIQNIETAFLWSCPYPFQALALHMGPTGYQRTLEDFGLLSLPAFEQAGEATPSAPETVDLRAEGIGQGALTVSPLQMVLATSAFANHGQMPALQVVLAIRSPGGEWQTARQSGNPRGAISPASADRIKALMRHTDQAVSPPETAPLYEHIGIALAGPAYHTWFIGFGYTESGRPIAIAVLVEDTSNAEIAARIGRKMLLKSISAYP